jgi:hypothetical protein
VDPYRGQDEWATRGPYGAFNAPKAPRVANPPPRRLRYYGPPSYASPPRWGFPALAWRWPTSVPGTRDRAPASPERVRVLAGYTTAALWILAAAAVFAAGGEVWRYVLLIRSRTGALSRRLVETSDALVVTGAILSITLGLIAAVLTLWWLVLARRVAGELAGRDPARPDWQLLVCLIIPGANLVMPGLVLAELEHAVLRRPVDLRPRPTRLIVWWWAAWILSGLLWTVALLWRLRTGVQAHADGVVLTAVIYLVAGAVAVLTVRVVRRVSTLLAPIDPASVRLMRVIRVEGAPAPPLRPGRPVGSVR